MFSVTKSLIGTLGEQLVCEGLLDPTLTAAHYVPELTGSAFGDATVRQLGDIVLKAASGELQPGGEGGAAGEGGGAKYRSDGRIVALACGAAGIESARQVLAAYDAACPPTIVLFDADPAAVENAVRAMRHSLPCQLGDAVRIIEVVYPQGTELPCEVHYTKDGQNSVLWRASNEAGYCEQQAASFAEKQRNWGWQCVVTAGAAKAEADTP